VWLPSPTLLFAATTATTLATLALVAGDLPDRVPTHFDASGRADGWSTRNGFIVTMGGLSLFLAALLAGMSAVVARLPTSLLNMPHRDYWLAPPRRAATLVAFAAQVHALGAASQVLVLGIVLYCVRASRAPEPQAEPDRALWVMLGAFLAFVVAWLIGLHRRFRLPARETNPV
jgi:uncharacterized membrane protein